MWRGEGIPALVASMYGVYHGPEGLTRIARRVASYTAVLASGLQQLGCTLLNSSAFDTVQIDTGARTDAVMQAAPDAGYHLRRASATSVRITPHEHDPPPD